MRRITLVALAAALVLIAGRPALAIVYGHPDGNLHPQVGAMVVTFEGETFTFCSGTLISPTVFLTAAHCTEAAKEFFDLEPDDFEVTFDPTFDESSPTVPGTAFSDPLFGSGGFSDAHDIAVVVLDAPYTAATPAQLPTAGLLDRLKASGELKTATFTAVGYGAVRESRKQGPQEILDNNERRYATQSLLALRPAWLTLSMNQATGDGGTCFGDSGGPHFLGGPTSNLIVSLTVTGDAVCKATDVTYRVDTSAARAFLDDFVTLP